MASLDSEEKNKENIHEIPVPPGTRLREFRIRYIPAIVFLATLAMVILLWRELPSGGGIRGIGEGAVSLMTSPHDGFIEEVTVAPHGWIEAGQPLLTVVPFDPRSQLDLFQSQLQLSRLALEPSIADRTAVDYEQLRIAGLSLRQELAMAKANLARAERVLPRHEELMKKNLLSKDVYDITLRDHQFYTAEVEEKTKALAEIDKQLERLSSMVQRDPSANPAVAKVLPMLETQIQQVETNWNPAVLQAPISGEVQFYRQRGEFVRAGEPILVINSPKADRVVAYMKQPMTFEPQLGMPMEVITRSANRQKILTQISQIGARVEIITNSLAFIPPGSLVDSGLPLILPLPENISIRPGEIVDIVRGPVEGESVWKRIFRN